MSDNRFRLKVNFEIYGEKFEWEASLNWFSDDGEIDERIKNWFLMCYGNAYTKYQERICEDNHNSMMLEQETRELAELERLKAKYENPKINERMKK